MYLIVIRIFPGAVETERVRKYLSGVLGPTRIQPGCALSSLATELDPEAILYLEAWQSEEDLDRRLKSVEFKKILRALELSAIKPDVWIYEVKRREGLEYIEQVISNAREREAVPTGPHQVADI